jgi:virulence-associated protein VapD
MKEVRQYKILEALSGGVSLVSDLFTIFTAPYGTSFSGMGYRLEEARRKRHQAKNPDRERQSFNELLYRLRRDNLIGPSSKNRLKIPMLLTKKGKARLNALRKKAKHAFPMPAYALEKDSVIKIVVFDIPERERKKRDWLRVALHQLGFRMLQRSVWIGRTKIPEDFLSDLRRLKLFQYIEIIAITKTGSLKPLALI